MNAISFAFVVSLTALTAVSLAGKVHRLSDHGGVGGAQSAAAHAVEQLQADGWALVATRSLTADGLASIQVLASLRCTGAVMIVGLPPTGEAGPLVDRLAGPNGFVLYLDRDRLSSTPPGMDAYMTAKLAPLLARLGQVEILGMSQPPVAVVMREGCADSSLLPWTLARQAE